MIKTILTIIFIIICVFLSAVTYCRRQIGRSVRFHRRYG